MIASLLGRKLIIGVDRLDYSKGLTERFAAFEQFLETFPDNQGKVTFLQIAPLSRSDVLAYSEIRQAWSRPRAASTGASRRRTGRRSAISTATSRTRDADGIPARRAGGARHAGARRHESRREGIRRRTGSRRSRRADPVADGGRRARAQRSALQVNPYDKRGLALALQTRAHMPLEERRKRHQQMLEAVRRHDIHNWYGTFVLDLTGEHLGSSPAELRLQVARIAATRRAA